MSKRAMLREFSTARSQFIKLFLTQLRQWENSVGATLSQQSLGRV
jgi:hypothetical protein